MNKKKKICLVAGILIILVFVLVFLLGGNVNNKNYFDELVTETLKLYPYAGSLGVADDGSYMVFDINPNASFYYKENMFEESLKALKHINKELGFSPALYEKMISTTSVMGAQMDSNKDFEVTWKYNTEDGLKIIYERK